MHQVTSSRTLHCGTADITVLLGADAAFLGIGAVAIGGVAVRSGRLPMFPLAQSFSQASELASARLLGIEESAGGFRVRLAPAFRRMPTLPLRDHSFDPIHPTDDWDDTATEEDGTLDLVLTPDTATFDGVTASGFRYAWEYRGARPLWWIMDRASWELGGDIVGASAYSQSACSAPVARFAADTAWTTEGKLFWMAGNPRLNSIMTHNLPRFASHGSFDFQHKEGMALVGIFARVGLIRSVLCRDPHRAELRHFDKHIDDESSTFATVPKSILLFPRLAAGQQRDEVDMQNLWTTIHQTVEQRARAEFGIVEQPFEPQVSWNFWAGFTIDSYRRDLVPAAAALGIKRIFVDNLKKSAMTEEAPLKGVFNWNMCAPHEYEISPRLGGDESLRRLVADCAAQGITVVSWTNNMQALSSPLNKAEREDGETGNYVLLEDARQKFGGAYLGAMSALDLAVPDVRERWIADHLRIREATGLGAYLFDSFYNLGFTPINFRGCRPRTMWRSTLEAVRRLQQAGVEFHIESFGPFGRPQHGHPKSYDHSCIFICLGVGLGNDYTTVPSGHPLCESQPDEASAIYYGLAHQAIDSIPLFKDERRIDHVWGAAHKQALADYHRVLPQLRKRVLQRDGGAVVWHDDQRTTATIFNFTARPVALAGTVVDVTAGTTLPAAATYRLTPWTTYQVTSDTLPTQLS